MTPLPSSPFILSSTTITRQDILFRFVFTRLNILQQYYYAKTCILINNLIYDNKSLLIIIIINKILALKLNRSLNSDPLVYHIYKLKKFLNKIKI